MKKLIKGLLVAGVAFTSILGASPVEAKTESLSGQEFLSVGKHVLSDQSTYNQTISLLQAQNFSTDEAIIVDGVMINQYLHDGSDADTPVYSSSKVRFNSGDTGVTVNIATPQNILNVSKSTYINAAITSGVKNAHIEVASATPVTGEGALTGIYAILAKEGVLEQASAELAQEEIVLVDTVVNDSQINSDVANAMMADIKAEVAQVVQDGDIVNGDKITNIINETMNNYNINMTPAVQDQLSNFAQRFANTDVALDKDTLNQLGDLSNTLFEQGGELFSGVKSTLQDPEFQREAAGFFSKVFTAIGNFFKAVGEFLGGLFN